MTKISMNLIFRSLIVFACVSFASASTVTVNFTDLPINTVNGFYVGYAKATVSDVDSAPYDYSLICNDFTSHTYIPSGPFAYNVSTLTSLADVRFQAGTPATLTNYEVAAILLDQFDKLAATMTASDVGAYQYALWNLFTPAVAGEYGNSASLLQAAQASQADSSDKSGAYNRLLVFTPAADSVSNQEFLGVAHAPEPATLLIMGAGLLCIGLLKRKRKA